MHHWLMIRFPLVSAEGKVEILAGMAMNITERKQAEEGLKESIP